MKILNQPSRKSELTCIVTLRGRMIHVDLILPVDRGRMPRWLADLLAPHTERFAQEWCPDHWAALCRLSFLKDWRDRWGSVEGQEWFVSEPVPPKEQAGGEIFP